MRVAVEHHRRRGSRDDEQSTGWAAKRQAILAAAADRDLWETYSPNSRPQPVAVTEIRITAASRAVPPG